MNAQILQREDISDLESECIADGKLTVKPFAYYQQFSSNKLHYFMYQHGYYILPTTELVDYLKTRIIGKAIEIACGNGAMGRALKLPLTDSKLQEDETIGAYYKLLNQPVIDYPEDVEKLDAIQAVNRYKPDTVVGSYVTHKWEPGMNDGNAHGVDYQILFSKVRRIIMVGNKGVHQPNPFMKKKHNEFFFPWLITRSSTPDRNRIFIWTK